MKVAGVVKQRSHNLASGGAIHAVNRSNLATFLAALAAIGSWLFFDQAKHNAILSSHAGFLDDPYDAIGSFGIQIGAFAAFVAVVWLLIQWKTRSTGWQQRGVTVTAICCITVGIADLTGQALTIGLASAGIWIMAGIVLLVASGVGLLLLNPRLPGQLPSLLAVLGSWAPVGGRPFRWADRHPVVTSLGVGLTNGLALAIAHQVLEGGPTDTPSLILLSAFFVVGEGAVVAASWFFIGRWLRIYSGPRKSPGPI